MTVNVFFIHRDRRAVQNSGNFYYASHLLVYLDQTRPHHSLVDTTPSRIVVLTADARIVAIMFSHEFPLDNTALPY